MIDMSKHKISFGSVIISFDLSYLDRKTLGIKVYPDCSVKVIAPLNSNQELIVSKVREKAPWILKKQNEFLRYHPLTPQRKYVNGETHLYLGKQYRIQINESQENSVKLTKGKLIVNHVSSIHPERLLLDWYKEKSIILFHDLLTESISKFTKYNLCIPPLQIRYMKKRWGSCTPNGKVILNVDLIRAPKGCIEYVIIHELCHLIHHSHNKSFYELQDSIIPDWKRWKDRLEHTLV